MFKGLNDKLLEKVEEEMRIDLDRVYIDFERALNKEFKDTCCKIMFSEFITINK